MSNFVRPRRENRSRWPAAIAAVVAIGLGAMALGFIPLIAYRHSPYLHEKPTLGRTLVAPEPEPAIETETIVG